MKEKTIVIIMATYNGEKYIEEQLQSIVNQTYKNWRMYIHDDGSTDNTVRIIQNFIIKYNNIYLVSHDNLKSAYKNFMYLLKEYGKDADYIMFSDQDDIWAVDKVMKTYNKIIETDNAGKPCCVFTDYELYMQGTKERRHSKTRVTSNCFSLKYLLTENCAIGATMMINRSAQKMLSEWNLMEYGMHDWTAMLICALFGKIGYLNDRTMLYRQHEKNVIGHSESEIEYFVKRLDVKKNMKRIKGYFIQARYLEDMAKKHMGYNEEEYIILREFANIPYYHKLARMRILIKCGYLNGNMLKKLGLVFMV